ncbi:hypothetical protein [Microbacterium sp.]|uniref:hypothetical protein n=1 Tax=Microbacterium sp. TaxID=51671 RepID=UPI003F9DDB10
MSTTAVRKRITPTVRLYVVLVALTVFVVFMSLVGNPFGPYFAAYVSTALVMFGLLDLLRQIRRRGSLQQTIPVLITGIITGVFMTMPIILGPGLYVGFLIGQLFTVGLVYWLMTRKQVASD